MSSRLVAILSGLLALALLAELWLLSDRLRAGWHRTLDTLGVEATAPDIENLPKVTPSRPTALFVVLDNVRADRLSWCGHPRPTSPTLEARCAQGAECRCRGYAPSLWTLPSHASYFTGLEITEHRARIQGTGVALQWGGAATPLGGEPETLAERYRARGYQTVAVLGNPVVSRETGLLRGFDTVRGTTDFGLLYGVDLLHAATDVLRNEVDPTRPLFLFVNIADAHEPWWPVPERVEWTEPTTQSLHFDGWDRAGPRSRYQRGGMDEAEANDLRARLSSAYDYGVFRADRTLGQLLSVLEGIGWLDPGSTVVITSDHGEMLGEHGLLSHGGSYPYEGVTVVPVVAWGPVVELPPEPLSALVVFDILLGESARPRPVRSLAYPSLTWEDWFGYGGAAGVAVWRGNHKRMGSDRGTVAFDLRADPHEQAPTTVEDAEVAELRERLEALAASPDLPPPSDEMTSLLQQLGYVGEH